MKYRVHLRTVPLYKISKFHGCLAPVAPILTRPLYEEAVQSTLLGSSVKAGARGPIAPSILGRLLS